ncbi:MAG: cobalamin biosynthesis protein [Rhizobiaceae bacterium]|nr:cobalamin biosynthesis protein [Rhizobiaceae bacterium]
MIVAGIGSRRGVSAAEVLAAIDAALAEHDLDRNRLSMLATASIKKDEAGIIAASASMNLPLILVDQQALMNASPDTLTRSQASLVASGTPSVSEAAALAAAGLGARLAGPRTAVGAVTCALAFGDER